MDIQAFVNRFDPILDEELKREHRASTDIGESFGTQGTYGIHGTHGIQKPLFNPQNIDDLLSVSRGSDRSDAHTGDGRSDARSEGVDVQSGSGDARSGEGTYTGSGEGTYTAPDTGNGRAAVDIGGTGNAGDDGIEGVIYFLNAFNAAMTKAGFNFATDSEEFMDEYVVPAVKELKETFIENDNKILDIYREAGLDEMKVRWRNFNLDSIPGLNNHSPGIPGIVNSIKNRDSLKKAVPHDIE